MTEVFIFLYSVHVLRKNVKNYLLIRLFLHFLGYRVYVDDKPAAMINGLAALVHGLNTDVTYK